MREPFDLTAIVTPENERRVRIADMVGRRGRFLRCGAPSLLPQRTGATA